MRNISERCFESFLHARSVPFLRIEDTVRAVAFGERIKNFDYVVFPRHGRNLIVELKGKAGVAVDNWVGEADLESLAFWKQRFGPEYEAVLVYVLDFGAPLPGDAHVHAGRRFLLSAVTLGRYLRHCRVRSARWLTQSVPRAVFAQLAAPVAEFLS